MASEERSGEDGTGIVIAQIDHFENQTKKIRVRFVRPLLLVQRRLLREKRKDVLLDGLIQLSKDLHQNRHRCVGILSHDAERGIFLDDASGVKDLLQPTGHTFEGKKVRCRREIIGQRSKNCGEGPDRQRERRSMRGVTFDPHLPIESSDFIGEGQMLFVFELLERTVDDRTRRIHSLLGRNYRRLR